jgi:hypothetical protein
VQVDVEEARADRVELVLLDDRVVRLLLPLKDDVEDGVEAVIAGQRLAQLTFFDGERMRLVAVPIEDSRDEPSRTQAREAALPRDSLACTCSLTRSPAIPAEKCTDEIFASAEEPRRLAGSRDLT